MFVSSAMLLLLFFFLSSALFYILVRVHGASGLLCWSLHLCDVNTFCTRHCSGARINSLPACALLTVLSMMMVCMQLVVFMLASIQSIASLATSAIAHFWPKQAAREVEVSGTHKCTTAQLRYLNYAGLWLLPSHRTACRLWPPSSESCF